MKISLHGSYFGNNYGDILLMKMFTRWVHEYDPTAKINYPLLKKNLIIDPPGDATSGLWNLVRSDALVFFGGGYFGEKPIRKAKWRIKNCIHHVIVGLLAIVFHIPYAIIGVEFGPLSANWHRRLVVFIAKHAKLLVVRNEESKDFLIENGVKNVKLSCDAVLSLSDYVEPKMNEYSNNKILIHIANRNANVVNLIQSIIEVLKEHNVSSISYIEDEPGQFEKFYNDIISDLFSKANIRVDKYLYEGTDKVIEIINDSDIIITTKLHVGITGIALNKKVFSVYAHPKTLRLHKQVNNDSNCVALNDIDDTICGKIMEFYNKGRYNMPYSVLLASRENKRLLFEFLNGI